MENASITIIILTFLAFAIKLFLSLYIYKKNPSADVNRYFSLLFFSQSIWDLGKALSWISTNHDMALLFAKISYTGYIISVMLFPVFCWVFLKKAVVFRKKRIWKAAWFIPMFVLIGVLWSSGLLLNDLTPPAVSGFIWGVDLWGYEYGALYDYFFMWFQALPFLYGFILFIYSYFKTQLIDLKVRLKYLILAMSFPIIIGNLTGVILPELGIKLPPHNSILTALMTIFIGIGIIKYKFLTVKPNPEEISKKIKIPTDLDFFYPTELSNSYFVIGKDSIEKSYHILLSNLYKKYFGLVITSKNPDEIKKKYMLKNTPIIWITEEETEETYIGRNDLEQLHHTILEFAKKVGDSYILLDGLDTLVKYNNLIKVFHLIARIKEDIAAYNCCLLVPQGLLRLNKNEQHMLKKDLRFLPVKRIKGEISSALYSELRTMEKRNRNFVILGYTEVSETIIDEFERRDIKCTLVDVQEPKVFYPKSLVKFVEGDPLSRRVLDKLNINNIHTTVLVALSEDSDVILAINLIRQITHKALVIANIHNNDFVKISEDAGANYVVPSSTIGGKLLSLGIRSPHIVKWVMDSITFKEKDCQLLEFVVENNSYLIGKMILDIDRMLQEHAGVIALRSGEIFRELADDEYIVQKGDILIFLTHHTHLSLRKHIITHKNKKTIEKHIKNMSASGKMKSIRKRYKSKEDITQKKIYY